MYNKIWHQTQEALNSLLNNESEIIDPQSNKVYIFQMLATYYIKYVQIFRNLEDVYDQIVHPQKRLLIRKILDGVMGRILELKNEMVELELSEFHYFDDILQDLKLAPVSACSVLVSIACPSAQRAGQQYDELSRHTCGDSLHGQLSFCFREVR